MCEDNNNNQLRENLDQTFSIENIDSSIMTVEPDIIGNEELKHYLCSECKTLHLIKFNEGKIIIKCKR